MTAPDAPKGVDVDKPSAARIYDWYLGGTQNWAVDREFGRRAEKLWPLIRPISRANRAFMNRVVRSALDAGIRQFLDLGSGVPTAGNVHEIVRERLPASVVYVDYEPVAAAHSRLILDREGATGWAGLVQRDIRAPEAIFADEITERLIDWSQPVCLLMITVLHFLGPDDHPGELVATYRDRLAPGSWLAVTHGTCRPDAPPERAAEVRAFVDAYRDTSNPAYLRSADEIRPWFGGWPLLEPGMSALPDWRPDDPVSALDAEVRPFAWGAVARKP
ncbi:SAM-dependent methyltransferase [Amycolatopsis jejuensis]|uniref:SAM-dependent methyltransferase n=1 Tax=Amycolatopsis jejuensis TaxID=330084 RepID=UPI000B188D72|nr:SAM-dependent methyltransferase [Amycolatopsis jejuensis]